MRTRTKLSILLIVFSGILLSYLLSMTLFPSSWLTQLCGLSQSMMANCIFLIFSSLFVAWFFSEFIDFCYKKALLIRWRTSKIGKIFVSEGYVTEEDLREALREQTLRIGCASFVGRAGQTAGNSPSDPVPDGEDRPQSGARNPGRRIGTTPGPG